MSHSCLLSLFAAFAQHLQSAAFRDQAHHRDHPGAFRRRRKLPLPCLIAVMLTDMRKSVQAELDEFFAHLLLQAQLVREVSAQAFAQARVKLSGAAIPALNDWLIEQTARHGDWPLWHGLRLVAADASTLRLGLRASRVRHAARAEQIAFGLFLPGTELMLGPPCTAFTTTRAKCFLSISIAWARRTCCCLTVATLVAGCRRP